MGNLVVALFFQIIFVWEVYGKERTCQDMNTVYLSKVNNDYAVYQKKEQDKKDALINRISFARKILIHYRNNFNVSCSTIFSEKFAQKICSEEVINKGLASDKKDLARELLNHCSSRFYGESINNKANDKINSLEGGSPPPSCEKDVLIKVYDSGEGGCDVGNTKAADDWGCHFYHERKNLSMTRWPQTDPLELKRTVAQYAFTRTAATVPHPCKIKIEKSFFNNFICSKKDLDKEEKKMQDTLSKLKKDNPRTHIFRRDITRFDTSIELLEYCASDMFPEAQVWAKDKLASFEKMEKHDAIKLNRKKSCSNIDLRQETKNGKKRIPPIRDQDSLGWCFAYVTADFLSYYTGENISGLALSVRNYQDDLTNKDILLSETSGGTISNIFKKLKEHRNICTEKQVNSEETAFTGDIGHDLKTTLKKIEDFLNQKEEGDDISFYSSIRDHLLELFPNVNMQDFIDILKSENKNTVFIELINKACDKENSVSLPNDLALKIDGKMPLNRLHELLERKDLSVVTFDISLIVTDMHNMIHINSVVGRRYNEDKKRCEFMLRNTWGETCYPQYKHACEGGYLWIPERDLIKGIRSVLYKK